MSKWIAIPKLTPGDASLNPVQRRESLHKVRPEVETEQTDALQSIGLQPVESLEGTTNRPNSYQRLENLDAYVVNTWNTVTAARAVDVLSNSHAIVPAISLTTDRPWLTKQTTRLPATRSLWPQISGVSEAHKQGITGKGVLVGVLDTGCDADHIELRQKSIDFRYVPLDPSSDRLRAVRGFDVDHHGTHVCGILAGQRIGVAPDVELMVASVMESDTLRTTLDRVLTALDWMLKTLALPENIEKPALINFSLGFTPQSLDDKQNRLIVQTLHQFITTLLEEINVLPIVSIGNDGPNELRAPAYFKEPLSVGAVNFDLQPAWFSGGGVSPLTGEIEPDVVGFGVDIFSALERTIDGRSLYATMSGTSMAAPYVTGIAALYASCNPALQGSALHDQLMQNALPIQAARDRVGAGLARFVV